MSGKSYISYRNNKHSFPYLYEINRTPEDKVLEKFLEQVYNECQNNNENYENTRAHSELKNKVNARNSCCNDITNNPDIIEAEISRFLFRKELAKVRAEQKAMQADRI